MGYLRNHQYKPPLREIKRVGNWYRPEDQRTNHMPTEDEIFLMCQEIQKTWSPREKRRRLSSAYRNRVRLLILPAEPGGGRVSRKHSYD